MLPQLVGLFWTNPMPISKNRAAIPEVGEDEKLAMTNGNGNEWNLPRKIITARTRP